MASLFTPRHFSSAIALFVLIRVAWSIVRFIYVFVRPSRLQSLYRHGKEPYVLVTGSSDGIGLEFARALASRGFNVVLHGRNEWKLEGVKQRLAAAHPAVKFVVVTADCTQVDSSVSTVIKATKHLNLVGLINNAGGIPMVKRSFQPFSEYEAHEIDGIIALNVRWTAQITSGLLPILASHKPSFIMNIGSGSDTGLPYVAVYSSAKSFSRSFSRSLGAESKFDNTLKGIEILGINVGHTTDTVHLRDSPTFFTPNAQTVARGSLDRLGYGSMWISGYWGHELQDRLIGLVPDLIFLPSVTRLMYMLFQRETEERLRNKKSKDT